MKHVFNFKNQPFFVLTDKLKTEIMCYTNGERIPVCSKHVETASRMAVFYSDMKNNKDIAQAFDMACAILAQYQCNGTACTGDELQTVTADDCKECWKETIIRWVKQND